MKMHTHRNELGSKVLYSEDVKWLGTEMAGPRVHRTSVWTAVAFSETASFNNILKEHG